MKNAVIVKADLPEEKPVSASAMQVAREFDKASAYTKDIIQYILKQEQKKRENDRSREDQI